MTQIPKIKETFMINEKKVTIEMQPIKSSRINSVGFCHELSPPNTLSLIIKFQKGGIYLYKAVNHDRINRLMSSESPGKYFGESIMNKHSYIKIFQVLD